MMPLEGSLVFLNERDWDIWYYIHDVGNAYECDCIAEDTPAIVVRKRTQFPRLVAPEGTLEVTTGRETFWVRRNCDPAKWKY